MPRVLQPLRPTPSSRVAVGVPVRDGGKTLERALLSIVNQTHRNLEILISDNASTDATAEICTSFARADARIRYFRQPTLLAANDNFRFAFEQSESDWFMWASHDDVRDENYVEVLLSGFASNPRATLTFTDTKVFSDHSRAMEGVPSGITPSSTRGVPFPERYSLTVRNAAAQIYGLFRAEVLHSHRWPTLPVGHDWMLLMWSVSFGDAEYVPGSTFRQYVPASPRDAGYSHAYYWLRGRSRLDGVQHLPDVRWALQAAREIAYAREVQGLETHWRELLPMLFFIHHGGPKAWLSQFLYWNAPQRLRNAWHGLGGPLDSAKRR
jgi:glycosyltransferase involved in cell wall biosynthesis